MGSFYGSVHLKTDDYVKVCMGLRSISKKCKCDFLVARPQNGWVNVYPSESGQDDGISLLIAKKLKKVDHVVHVMVHDDDVFGYWYYRRGKPIDRYLSPPNYIGEMPEGDRESWKGNPDLFEELLEGLDGVENVRRVLAPAEDGAGFSIATDKLGGFAKVLGIVGPPTSYEYLVEEGAGEEGGDYAHVPAKKAARKRGRNTPAVSKTVTDRFKADGLLLGECHPPQDNSMPSWCVDRSRPSGFFMIWSHGFPADAPAILHRYTPPWGNDPVNIDLGAKGYVNCLVASPGGRYLAIGSTESSGTRGRLIETANMKTVECGLSDSLVLLQGFDQDESFVLFTTQEGAVTIAVESASSQVKWCAGSEGSRLFAISHDGKVGVVAADQPMGIHLVDIETGSVLKSVYFAHPPSAIDQELIQKMMAEGRVADVSSYLKDKIDAADAETSELQKLFSFDQVSGMTFAADGRFLIVTSMRGVFCYQWGAICDAPDSESPPAVYSLELGDIGLGELYPGVPAGGGMLYSPTYSSVYDCVFCGATDGALYYLDLRSGRGGVLLESLGSEWTFDLDVSSDGSTLFVMVRDSNIRSNLPPVLRMWNLPELCKRAGISLATDQINQSTRSSLRRCSDRR